MLCGGGFDDPSCQCHEMAFRGKKEGAEKFQEICFCNCLLDGALAQAVRITLREIGSSKGHTTPRCNLSKLLFSKVLWQDAFCPKIFFAKRYWTKFTF